jgi:hypothetical protein
MGHYYLQMRLAAGSYVLIADESILIGNQKLLVVLAVRQTPDLCRIAPLTMADVSVIHVQASTSWKGADIAAVIQQASQAPGVRVTYAVSDKGTNLRKAFSICELPYIEDVTHRLATEARLLFE